MADTITIPYFPRSWAKQFHDCGKRWIVLVLHRRAGKTVACINHLIRDAIKIKGAKFAYIAPTYKQAKSVAWDYLKQFSRPIPGIKINESELRIDYPNGSRITLYGADNPDSLRGIALWGVVFDEYSQQPSNIFSEIIRPALADHQGYAIWIGTPKGKNEFWRLYEGLDYEGKKRDDLDKWLRLLLTIDQTDTIKPTELEDARKSMTEEEYLQEWYCSFEASIKGAYYSKEVAEARRSGRIGIVSYDPMLPVHTFWDLGISDYTTIGFFQLTGSEKRMIDYYENHGQGLNHYTKIVKEKPYTYGSHNFPHDVEVRELGSGKSRKEILEALGLTVSVVPNLPIMDGINAGRLTFATLFIDAVNCQKFVDAISQYRQEWDDSKGTFRDKPLHDWTSHAADMYRYFAVTEKTITNAVAFSKTMQYNQSVYDDNPYQ